jgi:hypothetical protein
MEFYVRKQSICIPFSVLLNILTGKHILLIYRICHVTKYKFNRTLEDSKEKRADASLSCAELFISLFGLIEGNVTRLKLR